VLSDLHLALGDRGLARAAAATSRAGAERLRSARLLSRALLAAARAGADTADPAETSASFEAALAHAGAAGTPYERAAALRAFGEYLHARQTDRHRAAAMLEEARGLLERLARPIADPSGSNRRDAATPIGG
jgi:hypothetical protein